MRKEMKRNMESIDENQVMRTAMKERSMRQSDLAERMGTTQNNVSGNINRRKISLEMFKRIMDAMEYDIVVMDRRDGTAKWKVV